MAAKSLSILLFGATGPSGTYTLQEALDRGHKVTAVVRNPDRLPIKHENLTVVTGDATDRSTFTEAMKDKDAVVSCLGAKYQFFGTVELYSKSVKEIHAAMVENNIKRGVFMSSWGTGNAPVNLSWKFRFVVYMIGTLLADLERMENYLETSATDIDYTVVRPPGLVNGPKTKLEFLVKENVNCIPEVGGRIMRADVGRFLLDCLNTEEYNKKMLAIATKPE